MKEKTVLIVDDDPWVCRMIATLLERRGHGTLVAADGIEALALAKQHKPDLIITDVMMPNLDGWGLIKAVRAQKELSLTPVIFLTALSKDEDRILGFRLGADDVLQKPFRFEELALRIEKALRQSQLLRTHVASFSEEKTPVSMKGDLSQLGVCAILTMLEMERKSGLLVLRSTKTARLFLRQGSIISAFIEGENIKGEDAVYLALTFVEGGFEFSAIDVEMEDEINRSTTYLLMEGARKIDEESPHRSGL